MRVLRGRGPDHERDHRHTRRLVARAGETGEPALRVWTPHRQVAFGRRDARSDGHDRAREVARERGYAVLEREVGGRAVAHTGTTVALVHARPLGDGRGSIRARYDAASERLQRALRAVGVDATAGEPPDAFCPGSHSLQVDHGDRERKVAGLAQRVRGDVAAVAAALVVADHGEIADVLAPVYSALDVPFDPDSVGSLAAADGPADPERVVEALVAAFADDPTVEHIRET